MKPEVHIPITLLTILVLTSLSAAAECVPGIDGYCDPECLEVDFDCARNPNQESKQQPIDEKNNTSYEPSNPYKGLLENDSLIVIGTDKQSLPSYEREKDGASRRLYFYAVGLAAFLLLSGMAFLAMHRLELKRGDDKELLESIIFHMKRLRHRGHSDEEIKKMFLQRQHHPKMIEKAFKALERKP
ncbi:MAG: hypothetical protein ACLFTH_00155 [Candidatus Woesearchaeota archaeon]